mgnify:CR=1 FL=1
MEGLKELLRFSLSPVHTSLVASYTHTHFTVLFVQARTDASWRTRAPPDTSFCFSRTILWRSGWMRESSTSGCISSLPTLCHGRRSLASSSMALLCATGTRWAASYHPRQDHLSLLLPRNKYHDQAVRLYHFCHPPQSVQSLSRSRRWFRWRTAPDTPFSSRPFFQYLYTF